MLFSCIFCLGDSLIYFFLISFLFFSIVDYIYIYSYFDSKFFLNKSGSKLNYLVGLENNKKNFKYDFITIFSKNKLITFFKGLIYMFLMQLLNIIVFHKAIFSKFLIINLGYKKIELVSTFDSYWNSFIKIYYLVYTVFLIITYVIYDTKFKNKYKVKSENENLVANDSSKIYLGSTIQKNKVYIDKKELYKNVLITGSIGTGKTSGAINTFCKYMVQKRYLWTCNRYKRQLCE